MKPVSVRFRCFGPYVQEQFIDFSELERNGLFLICGETGAGKTTILDAICYALYGRSSGGLRGDISVMRCKLAEKHEETLVEFIFDCNGKRYQFVRSLKYGRKNLNDFHNCLVKEGEVYVPLLENPKATSVNKKAEELIGLTYEQFRQVIILPQGQFERLLVSNSEEKEQILVSLFHADRWQKMAEELYRRVAERDKALDAEKLGISAKLKSYGCESLEALAGKLEESRLHRDQLKALAEAAEQDAAVKKQIWEQALLDNQEFEALGKLENEYRELRNQEDFFAGEEAVLHNAGAAERIRPVFAAWETAKERKLRAEARLENKTAVCRKAEEMLQAVLLRQTRHENIRTEYTEWKQRLMLLENARELYRSLSEKQRRAAQAEKQLGLSERTWKQAEEAFAQKDRHWLQAVAAQDAAIREWQQGQNLYLQSIGSVLAGKLADGEPCPVCGSREHPHPAPKEGARISEGELDGLNRAMNQANVRATAALGQRTAAENVLKEAEMGYRQSQQILAVAQADYENALSRKVEGIASEQALEAAIRDLQKNIRDYDLQEQQLAADLAGAQGDRKAAQAELQTAGEDLEAARVACLLQQTQWQEALEKSGLIREEAFHKANMDQEEHQRRTAQLLRFRANLARSAEALEKQRAALTGKNPPDMESIRRAQAEGERQSREMASRLALAESSLGEMEKDLQSLLVRQKAYLAERETVNGNMDFANRLRGRSGISLQRYVLGVMLTAITVEANRLLAKVYGGRYRLYRTNEVAGAARKSGLELEVYDSQNNQKRSVTTLSGGEKFLVALSLAIGLSTVVQAQGGGIRLEAMFIDEGFGSLDREAIGDALGVLQDIQRSAGTVGIISHVEALAETIPTKIQIIKGSRGSRCLIHS